MRIGMTYDLRDDYIARGFSLEETLEFDSCETIDAIAEALLHLGHEVDRIGNIEALVARLARKDSWDLVFNIAEGLRGMGREAQIPALLDAYSIPYTFSDPLVLALTLDKAMTKRVVRDLGLATPDFTVVHTMDDVAGIALGHRLFAKPLAEGTGKGVDATSIVQTRGELEAICARLLERFQQPVLVERYLPGREYTVSILGSGSKARSAGVLEVILRDAAEPGVYSMENKERCEDLVDYRLADGPDAHASVELALAVWQGLGCRDGGRVDVRLDEHGTAQFIEVNPLAGLHPTHSDLPITCGLAGVGFHEIIRQILASAMERVECNTLRGAA
ncbi:MAG: D-alanine--D-alanine ligase [Proteobacteria bacterium]|nr:D-alanine--D-alanine ligase [Pseudomonadota bacterium]MBU1611728.1 D-alanine--D-alanine ligase [Pseudomonadota bacterium]